MSLLQFFKKYVTRTFINLRESGPFKPAQNHSNFYSILIITREKIPESTQTTKDRFTEPVLSITPPGLTKIPEPIILPTITVHPFMRLIFASSRISPSSACSGVLRIFSAIIRSGSRYS